MYARKILRFPQELIQNLIKKEIGNCIASRDMPRGSATFSRSKRCEACPDEKF
jgi:hypothetical protein